MELDGRVVVITGASRGIGKGLALGLAAHGARVVCAARTVEPRADGLPGTIQGTVDEIEAAGGTAHAVQCDIGVEADLARLVETTLDVYGRIDGLINNAMAETRAPFLESTVEQFDTSMRVNLRSLYLLCRAVVPHMNEAGGGSIVNISSGGAGHDSTPFLPPGFTIYVTAKAAMERFTTALAPEVRPLGVTVNALRPGAVKTEMVVHTLGADNDWTGWTTPEAVVPAALFLAQQIGTDFTGRVLESTQYGIAWP